MANHLGPFPEDSDGPEGQEQPVRTVGGQGELHGVTCLPSLLEMHFLKPFVLGKANHLGLFPEASDGPEWQEQPILAVRGQGELH